MKKIFILLLAVTFFHSSFFCYASDSFDYGLNEATDVNYIDNFTMTDNTTGISNTISTTVDFVPLFNRSVIIPIRKNISALERGFCKMNSKTYDTAGVYLGSYCGEKSNYTLTLSGKNYSLSVLSEDGEVGIGSIPEGEFSVHIHNNEDRDLSCNTYLMGKGLGYYTGGRIQYKFKLLR